MKRFASKNLTDHERDDAERSIVPFWDRYIGFESQIFFKDMQNAVSLCLKDLSIKTNKNKSFLEIIMQLTPQRRNDYSAIDSMLKSQGVKDADRAITLDGHDFACHSKNPIDFISFDDECYIGAKNVEILCFNSVKGKYDFNAS